MLPPDPTSSRPSSSGDAGSTGLSCLVISRTPALLNRMLASLQQARAFWHPGDEVLCSWNGSAEAEADLAPASAASPGFRIAQREPYHFASNMNALAHQAQGRWLLLLNDDLILDPGSIDRALHQLDQHPEVGVLGGQLRCSDGRLGHAGLLFSNQGLPYNRLRPQLGSLIDPNSPEALESGPIPAVTGALMLLRRSDFLAVGGLRETFRVCGEDIALCLDLWHQLNKTPYYASDVTAIHDEKSTRGNTPDQHDILAVGQLAAPHIQSDSAFQASQCHWALQEAELLYRLCEVSRQQLAQREDQWAARERDWADKQRHWAERQRHWANESEMLQAKIMDLGQQIEAMLRSSSWVMTRPWRALGRCLTSTSKRSS
ncbi:glycosyltransferase family 2 protein [Synechococcus sp. CS-1328]|uniref:glycosyltransferase family 2 protein n=1 Tax=Synechococcus sp. CS-1328 TaxID=2847976 RepID=UPI00223BC9C4|nr:glycosyltransferase [Synechococcus sp. CS-1328]MCT0224974.1 glycosyltransferase [Synechococcus sp. CS-1328]